MRTTLALALVVFGLGFASAASAAPADFDPLEKVNRPIFWFNDKLDVFLLEPIAKGWDFVVPDRAQGAISDVFDNARFPVDFSNELLQGKPASAGKALGRFLLNSTLGMAGLFDVAKAAGLPGRQEDFGQTLGVWGIRNGPYLVLPVLGPSTFRDACGRAVDSPMRVWPFFVGTIPSIGITSTEVVNWRARNLESIRDLRKDAFDYYSLVRNAYLSNREAEVADHAAPERGAEKPDTEPEEDLYFTDDEE
ncbi:MAG TPA: VacJ family lipoprotein [Candidatus Binatia bacterium]|nr:VacJ family lipoprotein [Candidatus Binatia bacterium]